MAFIWYASAAFFDVYLVVRKLPVVLVVQQALFSTLSACIVFQYLWFDSSHSKRASLILGAAMPFSAAVVGTAIYFVLKKLAELSWLGTTVAALSVIGVVLGFLPQYYEIAVTKTVDISFVFLALDMTGGVLSFSALLFAPPPMDWWAASVYLGVVMFESVIVCLAIFFQFHEWEDKTTQHQLILPKPAVEQPLEANL